MKQIRKKPSGAEYQELVTSYKENSHLGKLVLAKSYGVTLDTLKHWCSDGETPVKEKVAVAPKMTVCVEELLGMRPAVNLDFVCFDLETSNLDADFSVLLTACIKPFGQPVKIFRADNYPEWKTDRANDAKITCDIADELRKHAIVIGHYSQKFDVPFLRAKMAKHQLEPLPQMFGIDTWRIAKNNFKVTSRRLRNLVHFFDLGDKDSVEGGLWMDAAYNGDIDAMNKIVEHNVRDVEILEKLAAISFPYLKSIPKL